MIDPPIDRARSASVRYVNERGAYRFSYPASWELTERGKRAAVESPTGAAVVTVGTMEGTSDEAVDFFVGRIAALYEDVEIHRWETTRDGSIPLRGTATDPSGSRKRIMATVARGRSDPVVIGAFVPITDATLEEDAMAILRSFRPLEGRADVEG